jgi:hypothetical protein
MHNFAAISRNRRWLAGLLALMVLVACGPAPAANPTPQAATFAPTTTQATDQPTSAAQPTTIPQPTAAPAGTAVPAPTVAAEPTALPQAGALLPAPLYFVADNGQIWRIERDGVTRRQITFERERVGQFDIARGDNALVYLVGSNENRQIVRLDESGRREMLSGPVFSPRLSPDGERMAFQLFQPVDGMQIGRDQGSDTGIYLQYRNGGRPGLIQASDPITDTDNPPIDARLFYPIAWSPDGGRLLIGAYYAVGDGGFQAVKDLGDDAPIRIQDAFGEASWSDDGGAIVLAGGTVMLDALPGLWRADPRTGVSTKLVNPADDATAVLATGARMFADGTVYVFLAQANSPEVDAVNMVTPHRIRPGGDPEPLRAESYRVVDALWADDASGAVVATTLDPFAEIDGPLSWLPTDGGAAVALGVNGGQQRWGNEQAQPRADACDLFTPLAWEPAATRTQRAEVLDAQSRLAALGYGEVGAPDGFFGDQTREAVRAFQRANGLPDSGDIDCATWAPLLAGKGTRA